jgi:dTDP-4-amino-4,6-dideoxygalactose transaminase
MPESRPRQVEIPFVDVRAATDSLRGELDEAIARVLSRGWFLRGEETAAFEAEWAAYCGQKHCVACGSGTDALTLSAMAMEMETASVQANTLPLTAIGLARGGARVSIVDVGAAGHPSGASADLVPVLLYGRQPDQQERGASLFDAAHAHGWRPPVGATACWSFYPTKSLGALGDAGAVTTNDDTIAENLRMLAGPDDRLRHRSQINSRMDELQAAALRVKLRHLDEALSRRRELASLYREILPPAVTLIPGQIEGFNHLLVVSCDERDALQDYLLEHGIQTKVHFPTPLNRLDGPWVCEEDRLPGAESWCNRVLSLPCYPELPDEAVRHIATLIARRFG